MKVLTTLLLLASFTCRAEIVLLRQGETAPFEGALVDQAQMKEFRENKVKLDLETKQNGALKELNLRLEEKIDYHKAETRAVEKALSDMKIKSHAMSIGYFVLGVALTSLATKFAMETVK